MERQCGVGNRPLGPLANVCLDRHIRGSNPDFHCGLDNEHANHHQFCILLWNFIRVAGE
jgi:hypothetical protein